MVTATRRPVEIDRAPAVVNVITADYIEDRPSESVAKALGDQVGVVIERPVGEGIISPDVIAMRGLRFSERTLLLVDGQPWNSDYSGVYYFTAVPLEAVERIEIVRGPFSSLYGSSAMAGVIHVMTSSGGDGGMSPALKFSAGDFGRFEASQSLGFGGPSASCSVSHATYRSDNYYLNDDRTDVIDTENRGASWERFHAHARFKPSEDAELNVSAGSLSAVTGFGVSPNLSIDNELDADRDYLNATGLWRASKRAELFWGMDLIRDGRSYESETLIQVPPPAFVYAHSLNVSDTERVRLSAGANLGISDAQTLTLGAEGSLVHGEKKIVDYNTGAILPVVMRPGEELDRREESFSFYAQDDLRAAGGRVGLVLGARYDDYDLFGGEVSPKAAVVWNYSDDGRVRLSAGRAFRAPTLSERETPPYTMAPFLTYIGNPDLVPETVVSYELSFENEYADGGLRTRLTPFASEAEDFIDHVLLPDPLLPGGFILTPQNILDVGIEGVEAELSWEPAKCIRLFATYQYSETRNEETDDILDFHPRNVATFGALGRAGGRDGGPGLSLSFIGRYEDERRYTAFETGATGRIGGYTTYDARAAADLWSRRLTVYVDVFNVFDKDYYGTSIENVLPERNWTAGVELRFAF